MSDHPTKKQLKISPADAATTALAVLSLQCIECLISDFLENKDKGRLSLSCKELYGRKSSWQWKCYDCKEKISESNFSDMTTCTRCCKVACGERKDCKAFEVCGVFEEVTCLPCSFGSCVECGMIYCADCFPKVSKDGCWTGLSCGYNERACCIEWPSCKDCDCCSCDNCSGYCNKCGERFCCHCLDNWLEGAIMCKPCHENELDAIKNSK